MKTYRFTVKEHDDFGTMGLAPAWYPNGDPLEGMGAAHDILEHFPNDSGDTEGELMALGASIWIRADGNFWNGHRHYDELRDPQGDFPQIIGFNVDRENGRALRPAPRCNDSELRARAFRVTRAAMRLVWSENRDSENRLGFSRADWRNVAGWIAQGFRRAERRYRGHSAYDVAALFGEIEKRLNEALKYHEGNEGAEIKVQVNFKNLTAKIISEY